MKKIIYFCFPAVFLYLVGSLVGGFDATQWEPAAKALYVFASFLFGIFAMMIELED